MEDIIQYYNRELTNSKLIISKMVLKIGKTIKINYLMIILVLIIFISVFILKKFDVSWVLVMLFNEILFILISNLIINYQIYAQYTEKIEETSFFSLGRVFSIDYGTLDMVRIAKLKEFVNNNNFGKIEQLENIKERIAYVENQGRYESYIFKGFIGAGIIVIYNKFVDYQFNLMIRSMSIEKIFTALFMNFAGWILVVWLFEIILKFIYQIRLRKITRYKYIRNLLTGVIIEILKE